MKSVMGFIRYLYWGRRFQTNKKWNSLGYSEKSELLRQFCSLVEGKEAVKDEREFWE